MQELHASMRHYDLKVEKQDKEIVSSKIYSYKLLQQFFYLRQTINRIRWVN